MECKCGVCKAIRGETKGINSHFYGKFSELQPRFIDGRTLKKYYCIICKKEIGVNSALYGSHKCMSCSQRGKILTEEHKKKICSNLKHEFGVKNANWRGGKSFEEYSFLFNEQLKDRIRIRDNYKCQLCKIPELEFNRKLSIHHIDYNKKNNEESNLISLCNSCHQKTNSKQLFWIKLFQEKFNGIKINRR